MRVWKWGGGVGGGGLIVNAGAMTSPFKVEMITATAHWCLGCVRLLKGVWMHVRMWPSTLWCVSVAQTQPLGSNLFLPLYICLPPLSVVGDMASGGREARGKEHLMRQWRERRRRRRRRRRGRQVQRTPGAITGARQKRRQEIKVVLATWHYRLSEAVSELPSGSQRRWYYAGLQGWTAISVCDCIFAYKCLANALHLYRFNWTPSSAPCLLRIPNISPHLNKSLVKALPELVNILHAGISLSPPAFFCTLILLSVSIQGCMRAHFSHFFFSRQLVHIVPFDLRTPWHS